VPNEIVMSVAVVFSVAALAVLFIRLILAEKKRSEEIKEMLDFKNW